MKDLQVEKSNQDAASLSAACEPPKKGWGRLMRKLTQLGLQGKRHKNCLTIHTRPQTKKPLVLDPKHTPAKQHFISKK